MTETKTVLVLDGNSLTHRSYHAMSNTNLRDKQGRATWALKGFFSQLLGCVERVNADALVVGFDSRATDVDIRRSRYAEYKTNRGEKNPDLVSQLALLPEILNLCGIKVISQPGFEADDVVAHVAEHGKQTGWHTVIATSDRDAFGLINDHTSVLRIITGGVDASPLLNKDRLRTLVGINGDQYHQYAALRGDVSDNLNGVAGIGEKTAVKLLNEFPNMQAIWDDIENNNGDNVKAKTSASVLKKLTVEGAKDIWERNMFIMSPLANMFIDLDLSSKEDTAHLPLVGEKLETGLREVDLVGTINRAKRVLASAQYAPEPVNNHYHNEDPLPPYDEEPRQNVDTTWKNGIVDGFNPPPF